MGVRPGRFVVKTKEENIRFKREFHKLDLVIISFLFDFEEMIISKGTKVWNKIWTPLEESCGFNTYLERFNSSEDFSINLVPVEWKKKNSMILIRFHKTGISWHIAEGYIKLHGFSKELEQGKNSFIAISFSYEHEPLCIPKAKKEIKIDSEGPLEKLLFK